MGAKSPDKHFRVMFIRAFVMRNLYDSEAFDGTKLQVFAGFRGLAVQNFLSHSIHFAIGNMNAASSNFVLNLGQQFLAGLLGGVVYGAV